MAKKNTIFVLEKKNELLGADSVMCIHIYVNWLNREILLEWLTVNNLCVAGDSHYSQIKRVLQYMSKGRYARSLYAWNVSTNRPEYLTGEIRLYNRLPN